MSIIDKLYIGYYLKISKKERDPRFAAAVYLSIIIILSLAFPIVAYRVFANNYTDNNNQAMGLALKYSIGVLGFLLIFLPLYFYYTRDRIHTLIALFNSEPQIFQSFWKSFAMRSIWVIIVLFFLLILYHKYINKA